MGFQRGVLDALGGERSLIGDRGLGQRSSDVAEFTVVFGHDIALCVGDPMFHRLVAVDRGRIRCNRRRRVEHRGQNLVVDLETAAAFLGERLGLRDHGGNLLPDETDGGVEDAGVIRVHPCLLVPRRRKQHVRRVFVCEHRVHAG